MLGLIIVCGETSSIMIDWIIDPIAFFLIGSFGFEVESIKVHRLAT